MGNDEIDRVENHLARHIRAFGELLISFADGLAIDTDYDEAADDKPTHRQNQTLDRSAKSSRSSKEKQHTYRTMQEMILEALTDARARGKPGLPPSAIRQFISAHYGHNSTSVNATAWRMWHDLKLIQKDAETGLYSLLD